MFHLFNFCLSNTNWLKSVFVTFCTPYIYEERYCTTILVLLPPFTLNIGFIFFRFQWAAYTVSYFVTKTVHNKWQFIVFCLHIYFNQILKILIHDPWVCSHIYHDPLSSKRKNMSINKDVWIRKSLKAACFSAYSSVLFPISTSLHSLCSKTHVLWLLIKLPSPFSPHKNHLNPASRWILFPLPPLCLSEELPAKIIFHLLLSPLFLLFISNILFPLQTSLPRK